MCVLVRARVCVYVCVCVRVGVCTRILCLTKLKLGLLCHSTFNMALLRYTHVHPQTHLRTSPDTHTYTHTKDQAGWSIWLTYDELPNGWKRTVTSRHGPKALVVLQTKWRGAVVEAVDGVELPSV